MATIQSIADRPECHVCAARVVVLLEGKREDVDFQSPSEAYDAGWRVAAARVGSRQGILVFHCPRPECTEYVVDFHPTAKLKQHGELVACEVYEGPSQWWSGRGHRNERPARP